MSRDRDFNVVAFRDAAPYIYAHRQRTFVILFDSKAIDDTAFANLIHDVACLHSLGVRLVVVHGARVQIDARLRQQNIQPQLHNGLRITDDAVLEIAKQTTGSIRADIESKFSMGLINTPMSGMQIRVSTGNYVFAKPLGVREGVDFQHTGEVRKIDTEAIRRQLDLEHVVLLSPIGYSPTGEIFNLLAEDVATMAAASLQAHKLIFLTEGETLKDGRKRAIQQLDLQQAQTLINGRRKLNNKLRQYLENSISACLNNVDRVHLVNRLIDGALLKELYTRDGIGTLITRGEYENLHDATLRDVGGILELIAPLEEAGTLVRRSREQLELEISRFSVIERDGMIIACAGLYAFVEENCAELTCLIVHPDYQKNERGNTLLTHIENKAIKLGLSMLFVLTTQASHWFREHGFVTGNLNALPVKKRQLYNYQRNSKILLKSLG